MRYCEDRQVSGEIFRKAMQRMEKQKAAFTPPHLTIFYEAIAGLNPLLASILENRMSANSPLTDEDVSQLHSRHVTGRDIDTFEACQTALRSVLEGTTSELDKASKEASELAQALAAVGDSPEPETLKYFNARVGQFGRFLEEFSRTLLVKKADAGELFKLLERAQQPLRDALTGLPNRQGFDRAIDDRISRGHALTGAALLLIDIDHFKVINDTLGHLVGDEALAQVAKILGDSADPSEIPARLGGEEFAVLVPPHAGTRPIELADQIRSGVASLEVRSPIGEGSCRLTVSIGIALASEGETREELIHHADLAMYESKRTGRNRVSVWHRGSRK